LLGHALERAAGKPFDRLLQEMVCEPLKLKRTAIQGDERLRPATGYDRRSSHPLSHSVRERLAASGGLVASVEDLTKFLAAQMKPGVFSSEMLKQLHTESSLSNGSRAGTALGWSIESNEHIGRILEKNGGRSNCSAWIGFSPEHKVGVAVVTNCGGPAIDPIGEWLLERAVPGAGKPVTKSGNAKADSPTGVR
jgi:CubicO group peptidase (beta-lactamase class C family)